MDLDFLKKESSTFCLKRLRYNRCSFQSIYLLYFLLVFGVFVNKLSHAACPNACNGNGLCIEGNVCQCFEGWNGGAADCSARECPKGVAWTDKAYASSTAHQPVECSNAGFCDRGGGICKCSEGFSGTACQRGICPGEDTSLGVCSGHGECMSVADISFYHGVDYDTDGNAYPFDAEMGGDGYGVTYSQWDKDMTQMCKCENYYFGAACNQKMCAKGDDPLTINQHNYTFRFDVTASYTPSTFSGEIGLSFGGQTAYFD